MATPLIPFPRLKVRKSMSVSDCRACLDSWHLALTNYLCLSSEDFEELLASRPIVSGFLLSYVQEKAFAGDLGCIDSNILRGLCFRMIHRSLLSLHVPLIFKTFHFLSDLCLLYYRSEQLKTCLERFWLAQKLGESSQFLENRTSIQKLRVPGGTAVSTDEFLLKRVTALLFVCPKYGQFLMSGSGFLEWNMDVWNKALPNEKKIIINITYLAFRGYVASENKDMSSLLDHLHSLKLKADWKDEHNALSFTQYLCTQSPIVSMLQNCTKDLACDRMGSTLKYLQSLGGETYQPELSGRIVKHTERIKDLSEPVPGLHHHNMKAIARVQEVFPGTGAGFIRKLLDEYSEDVGTVLAHLLENSLPSHLAKLDRSEPLPSLHADGKNKKPLKAHSIPLYTRKKAYDEDDFDQLTLPEHKLHKGKKEHDNYEEGVIDKAKIFSSLSAFDLDDDERDDTYDVQDVGGSVDTSGHGNESEEIDMELNEKVLYLAWRANSSTFDRSRSARQSPERQTLRSETNMTDEAIEGFAHFLAKDKRKLASMERKYLEFKGEQEQLDSSRWSANDASSSIADRARSMRRGGNLRNGRGRYLERVGDVAEPTHGLGTQAARRKKDENKATWANHGRKTGRTRKVAWTGPPN